MPHLLGSALGGRGRFHVKSTGFQLQLLLLFISAKLGKFLLAALFQLAHLVAVFFFQVFGSLPHLLGTLVGI